MKACKAVSVLSVILTMLIPFCSCVTAFASEADIIPTGLCVEDAGEGIGTVVNFNNGYNYTAEGTVSLEATEKNPIIGSIRSLEITYDDKVILTIEPHDVAAAGALTNGYYAIGFPIPGSTKECFITGLTPQNAAETQERLLAHYAAEEWFSIEDLEYIDAEKLSSKGDGDDEMCWAAAASDMLQYSGWGAEAGFANEDDIFEAMINAFYDEAGDSGIGIEWFINGGSAKEDLKDPESGAYLPQYDPNTLTERVDFTYTEGPDGLEVSGMKEMLDSLKEGKAIGLSVSWLGYDDANGHEVTAWGLVTDNAVDDKLAAHYDAVIISDSDNNRPKGSDRRAAPNTLDLYQLREYSDDGSLSLAMMYQGSSAGYMWSFLALAPYSDAVPYETDPEATLDVRNDPDLSVSGISVEPFENQGLMDHREVYEGDVYLYASLINRGAAMKTDSVKLNVTVKNAAGDTVFEKSDEYNFRRGISAENILIGKLSSLPAGVYSVDIDVDPERDIKEALLVNNHFSGTFEAVGSKPDLSGAELSAEVGEFSQGRIPIYMDYHGLQDTEIYRRSDKVALMISYYGGDNRNAPFSYNYDSLPDTVICSSPYQKVRFRLAFYRDDLCAVSDCVEYDLPFPTVTFEPSEERGFYKDIKVESGGHELPDGEEIRFRLMNGSNDLIPEIGGTLQYLLLNGYTGEITQLTKPEHMTLKNGVLSDEITFAVWDADKPVYGRGSLLASFVCDDYDHYAIRKQIGTISANEKGSSVVDIKDDSSDPYDCHTSLREAAAYCQQSGGTVTFADGLTMLFLTDTLEVTGDLTINGLTADGNGQPHCIQLHSNYSTSLFEVRHGAELTLYNLALDGYSEAKKGGAVNCEGGSLIIDRCLFKYCNAEKGGAVYLDGGSAIFRNSGFYSCNGDIGAALCIENGTSAELLNTTVTQSRIAENGAVCNNGGRLNLINSAVIDCQYKSEALEKLDAVVSNGETHIVNSILTDTYVPFSSTAGSCELFCSAVGALGDGAVTDTLTRSFEPKTIVVFNESKEAPQLVYAPREALLYPEVTESAENGCLITAVDGELIVTAGGESIPTGIKTAFTNDELRFDILGSERTEGVCGPCEKLSERPVYPTGDADLDGTVDITDATVIQRYDVKMIKLSDTALRLADVDRDGDVCTVDATLIRRYLLGMYSFD